MSQLVIFSIKNSYLTFKGFHAQTSILIQRGTIALNVLGSARPERVVGPGGGSWRKRIRIRRIPLPSFKSDKPSLLMFGSDWFHGIRKGLILKTFKTERENETYSPLLYLDGGRIRASKTDAETETAPFPYGQAASLLIPRQIPWLSLMAQRAPLTLPPLKWVLRSFVSGISPFPVGQAALYSSFSGPW